MSIPRIVISARPYAGRPEAAGAAQRDSLGAETALLQAVAAQGAAVLVAPCLPDAAAARLLDGCSGLLLQGGGDIAPEFYGQAGQTGWRVDPARDRFELALLEHALRHGLAVLGLCRGCQLINVAHGGTLYRDIASELDTPARHSDPQRYTTHAHGLRLARDGLLAAIYSGVERSAVTSAHAQGVRALGAGLVAEAWSAEDGLIEALRCRNAAWALGVQWHPEFHAAGADLLPGATLFAAFVAAARAAMPA